MLSVLSAARRGCVQYDACNRARASRRSRHCSASATLSLPHMAWRLAPLPQCVPLQALAYGLAGSSCCCPAQGRATGKGVGCGRTTPLLFSLWFTAPTAHLQGKVLHDSHFLTQLNARVTFGSVKYCFKLRKSSAFYLIDIIDIMTQIITNSSDGGKRL